MEKNNHYPAWQYDEFKHVGTDYESEEEVQAYDERMQKLRNVPQEVDHALHDLELTSESTMLEIGTGTGEFAITAASRCRKVYAIDISEPMLRYAKTKADRRNVTNIEFRCAGFLTYEHEGEPLDAIVTQLALHHLPDYWKAVALVRMYDILKDGGKLFLRDVVFLDDIRNNPAVFDKWIAGVADASGEKMAQSLVQHIQQEYSTTNWIMEGLLTRTGFSIKSVNVNGIMTTYLCVKG
ncbi:MAG: class I SAM-dependent methyltransferase [Armatimonadota bacterium]